MSRRGDFLTSFGIGRVQIAEDANVDYDLDPSVERFYVHVPDDYTGRADYGLMVFMYPGDRITEEPPGWTPVLDRRRLLFVAPQKAGNGQATSRRLGLAVLAAEAMMHRYWIDPKRVYVSGWSGGARIAGLLGFVQPDVFHGTVQSCGADFYLHVPRLYATSDANGNSYGFFEANQSEIDHARHSVRFTFITGDNDFRRGNVLDVFNGGFARFGFQARLFDIPGMGHVPADGDALSAALGYVDAAAGAESLDEKERSSEANSDIHRK
jgi:hypothetical protein